MKLVWLDAHLDLKEKVEDHVSHDVVVRQLVEEGLFEPGEIYFVGITEVDYDEQGFLESNDFNIYRADELTQFLADYDFSEACYLSIDIDVLTEGEAPGTGYTDGRLSMEEVEKTVEKLKPKHADLVEVAPSLDQKNVTVRNAKTVLNKVVEAVDF